MAVSEEFLSIIEDKCESWLLRTTRRYESPFVKDYSN